MWVGLPRFLGDHACSQLTVMRAMKLMVLDSPATRRRRCMVSSARRRRAGFRSRLIRKARRSLCLCVRAYLALACRLRLCSLVIVMTAPSVRWHPTRAVVSGPQRPPRCALMGGKLSRVVGAVSQSQRSNFRVLGSFRPQTPGSATLTHFHCGHPFRVCHPPTSTRRAQRNGHAYRQ